MFRRFYKYCIYNEHGKCASHSFKQSSVRACIFDVRDVVVVVQFSVSCRRVDFNGGEDLGVKYTKK